ncbi:hypothetical protein AB6A40_003974 [Gnathostoma spinigerum]|uniref:Uncharacterized protein n=1 Tax=Gnathostoma spinigerum TaxID=75299 RepID=A0ABD6ELW5_9BILA
MFYEWLIPQQWLHQALNSSYFGGVSQLLVMYFVFIGWPSFRISYRRKSIAEFLHWLRGGTSSVWPTNEDDIRQARRRKKIFLLDEDVRREMPFRVIAATSFLFFMIVVGLPLWWKTTSTYRARFQKLLYMEPIIIPVSINLIHFQEDLMVTGSPIPSAEYLKEFYLANASKYNLNIEPFEVSYNIAQHTLGNMSELEASVRKWSEETNFAVNIAVVGPSLSLPELDGYWIYLDSKLTAFLKYVEDEEKMIENLVMVQTDVLMDFRQLHGIIRRNQKKPVEPWKTPNLSPSEQKRLAWNSPALGSHCNVHLYFIHTHDDGWYSMEQYSAIRLNVMRFVQKIHDITIISFNSEHLWDFDLSNWVEKDVVGSSFLQWQDVNAIITKIDAVTSTVESSLSLLKLVIIDSRDKIALHDQMGKEVEGVVIASWGALITSKHNDSTSASSRLIAALRALFGFDTDLPHGSKRSSSPISEWELERLKLHAYVDCLMNTVSSVHAMHDLVDQIDNVIIDDEIAGRINHATSLTTSAVKEGYRNFAAACEGQLLAVKAREDPSLLKLLYFPSDQKFAVYMPLFLPVLIPICGSVWMLYKLKFSEWLYHCEGNSFDVSDIS